MDPACEAWLSPGRGGEIRSREPTVRSSQRCSMHVRAQERATSFRHRTRTGLSQGSVPRYLLAARTRPGRRDMETPRAPPCSRAAAWAAASSSFTRAVARAIQRVSWGRRPGGNGKIRSGRASSASAASMEASRAAPSSDRGEEPPAAASGAPSASSSGRAGPGSVPLAVSGAGGLPLSPPSLALAPSAPSPDGPGCVSAPACTDGALPAS